MACSTHHESLLQQIAERSVALGRVILTYTRHSMPIPSDAHLTPSLITALLIIELVSVAAEQNKQGETVISPEEVRKLTIALPICAVGVMVILWFFCFGLPLLR